MTDVQLARRHLAEVDHLLEPATAQRATQLRIALPREALGAGVEVELADDPVEVAAVKFARALLERLGLLGLPVLEALELGLEFLVELPGDVVVHL